MGHSGNRQILADAAKPDDGEREAVNLRRLAEGSQHQAGRHVEWMMHCCTPSGRSGQTGRVSSSAVVSTDAPTARPPVLATEGGLVRFVRNLVSETQYPEFLSHAHHIVFVLGIVGVHADDPFCGVNGIRVRLRRGDF